jgi:class 3 adenylate cyclase
MSVALNASGQSVPQVRSEVAKLATPAAKVGRLTEVSRDLTRSNPDAAVLLAREAVSIAQKSQDPALQIRAYAHLGLVYMNLNRYREAIQPLEQTVTLRSRNASAAPAQIELSRDLRRLGISFEKINDLDNAERRYQDALSRAREARSNEEMAYSYNSLGELYLNQQRYQAAIEAFNQAIFRARESRMNQFVLTLEKNLASAVTLLQNFLNLQNLQMEVKGVQEAIATVRDSLAQEQASRQLLISEKELLELEKAKTDAELRAKEAELRAKDDQLKAQAAEQRNYLIGGAAAGIIVLIVIVALVGRYRSKQKSNRLLSVEKQKADRLLLNILPGPIAEELKARGRVEPRRFEQVSILFADLKGFTAIAARMSPEQLIEQLGDTFSHFDQIVERYGLEKIKTIGDAYMAVAGLTQPDPDHAYHAVAAALDMQAYMEELGWRQTSVGSTPWTLRVGIHSGPVIAGVIGEKKFAYDIWGDAVNLAARMETSGEVGKVNVSAATHELVKPFARAEPRGAIEVKNKGAVEMYFIHALVNRPVRVRQEG